MKDDLTDDHYCFKLERTIYSNRDKDAAIDRKKNSNNYTSERDDEFDRYSDELPVSAVKINETEEMEEEPRWFSNIPSPAKDRKTHTSSRQSDLASRSFENEDTDENCRSGRFTNSLSKILSYDEDARDRSSLPPLARRPLSAGPTRAYQNYEELDDSQSSKHKQTSMTPNTTLNNMNFLNESRVGRKWKYTKNREDSYSKDRKSELCRNEKLEFKEDGYFERECMREDRRTKKNIDNDIRWKVLSQVSSKNERYLEKFEKCDVQKNKKISSISKSINSKKAVSEDMIRNSWIISLDPSLRNLERVVTILNLCISESCFLMTRDQAFRVDQNSNTTIFPKRFEVPKFESRRIALDPVHVKISNDFSKIVVSMMSAKNKRLYAIDKVAAVRDRGSLADKALSVSGSWAGQKGKDVHGFLLQGHGCKRLELWSMEREMKCRWMDALKFLKNEKIRVLMKMLLSEAEEQKRNTNKR